MLPEGDAEICEERVIFAKCYEKTKRTGLPAGQVMR